MAEDLEANEQQETGRENQPGESVNPTNQAQERLAGEIVGDFFIADAVDQELQSKPDALSDEAKQQEIKEKQLKARPVIQKFENFCNLFRQAHISNQNELPASVNFSFMNLDSNEIIEAVLSCHNVILKNFLRNAQALQLGLMKWDSHCPEREALEGFLNRVVGASIPRLESDMVELDDLDGQPSSHSYAVFTFLRDYGNFGESQYQEVQKIFSRHPEYFEQMAQDFINDEEVLTDSRQSEYLALVLSYSSDETKNLILDRLNKLWRETDIPGDWESVSGVVGEMLKSWHKDTSAVGEHLLTRFVESQGKEAFQQRFFDRLNEIEKYAGSPEFYANSAKREKAIESIRNMSALLQRAFKDLDSGKQADCFESIVTIYSNALRYEKTYEFQSVFDNFLESVLQNLKNSEDADLRPDCTDDWINVMRHWSTYGGTKQYAENSFKIFGQKAFRSIANDDLTDNRAYEIFLRYGDKLLRQELVGKLFESTSDARTFCVRIAQLVSEDHVKEAGELLIPMLDLYGFSKTECEELINAWKVAGPIGKKRIGGDSLNNSQVVHSIENIQRLEQNHPGAAKILFDDFGIRVFSRYHYETLLAQVREKENRSLPYGIVALPREDWNGAFNKDLLVWADLKRQLEGKYLLRFVECNGKMDLVKRLIKFDKAYGEKQDDKGHKISFAIVGGHGNPESIQIANSDSKTGVLRKADLKRGSINKKINSLFIENPDVVLISCSTGADGGIGQTMSSSIEGARVIAPDISTNVNRIYADINGDTIALSVEFNKGTRTRVYASGSSQY